MRSFWRGHGYEVMIIFIVAFLLNIIWENIQAPLYVGYISFSQHFLPCLRATFFDAFFVLLMFLAYSELKNRNMQKVFIWSIIILIGLLTAIFIEYRAIFEDKWQYASSMPTVFLIGLLPLFQLSTTTILTIFLFEKINRNE